MENNINAEQLKYVFANMDDAVCAIRLNGEVFYANPAAEKLFGFSVLQKTKLWEAIPLVEQNDELIQMFINAVIKKERSFRSLVEYVSQDGQKFQLRVCLTCNAEAGMFLLVVSDLTKEYRLQSVFQRYTSPEIADYVLLTPEGEKQGGKDKEVTILMSDVRGFTAMSGRLSSADLITMLNHYFECMSAVIDSCSGTIIEFLGDGIFVVFGAPLDEPDHASHAVACAVGMQNAMEEVNAWNREHGWPDLEMGIGIHTGVCAVGNIGSDKRMKYGCMGEAVNLAGRLEADSVGGQILVSAATCAKVSEKLALSAENSVMPKGARKPFVFYEVTGIGDLQLRHPDAPETWQDLPGCPEFPFFELDEKTVTDRQHTGRLFRITENEKYAMLITDADLPPLMNLMLRIGNEDVYAKVVSREEGACLICFTSKPENLVKLLELPEKKRN